MKVAAEGQAVSASDVRLSREAVIDQALALLNEDGLEGVSLRKLAARLGVRAPSLYWYVPSKAELMSALMERVFLRCLDAVPDNDDWAEWLRAFGRSMWSSASATRDFGQLLASTDLSQERFDRISARLRERLGRLALPPEEAMEFQSTVQALVVGWATFWHAPYAKRFRAIVPDRVPLESLDEMIDGLKARVAARHEQN